MRARISGWVVLSAAGCLAGQADAQQYFRAADGTVNFTKAPFADVSNPANWDTITPTIAITRGDNQGIFNPITEPAYQGFSPEGTLWYFGGTVQDVIDGALDLAQFDVWVFAHGNSPPSVIGQDGVMYLVDADAYVDVRFTQWSIGSSGGGGFSYVRAVVPAPAAGPTLLGLAGVCSRRRRR